MVGRIQGIEPHRPAHRLLGLLSSPRRIQDAGLPEVVVGIARGQRHGARDLNEGLLIAPLLRQNLGHHGMSQRIGLPHRLGKGRLHAVIGALVPALGG